MQFNNYLDTQNANGMHYSEAIIGAPGLGSVSLILRYPNQLHLKSVEQCEFFEDFKAFVGKPMNENTVAEMRYLKNRIAHYIEAYDLYYDFKVPMISSTGEDLRTRFPIIEIKGV